MREYSAVASWLYYFLLEVVIWSITTEKWMGWILLCSTWSSTTTPVTHYCIRTTGECFQQFGVGGIGPGQRLLSQTQKLLLTVLKGLVTVRNPEVMASGVDTRCLAPMHEFVDSSRCWIPISGLAWSPCGIVEGCLWCFCYWKTPWNYL